MGTITVNKDFSDFCSNLKIPNYLIEKIRLRYHSITKRINQEYWGSTSDIQHSLYVGSYGRGTCIYTSDIDIIVELPWSIFSRYDKYSGNGQSALLQDVRNTIRKSYSTSNVSADGQVVDVDFSDGIKFEIVPAFKFDDGRYYYADTNNGGSWKSMNPKAEINAFNKMNNDCNGNLKRLCQMARAWNYTNSVCMSGILIDTLAYWFLEDYEYAKESFVYYDWMSRDFFRYLCDNGNRSYWLKPGSNECVTKKYWFTTEAKRSYEQCLEAISHYNNDYYYLWHQEWRNVFGYKFPDS